MRNSRFFELFSTLLGLGNFSPMPGTIASIAAFILYLLLTPSWWVILLLFVAGVYCSGIYSREKDRGDPSEVVIDELVGTWIAMYSLPPGLVLPALFLFRIIDILKPFPVNISEKLPGGLGIMADDAVGGIMTNLILWVIYWLYFRGGFSLIFS